MPTALVDGTAVLLLIALVLVVAGVVAVSWAVIRRSGRLWMLLAPRVAATGAWLRGRALLARLRLRFPRTVAFATDRLSLSGWLGLHLTLGLVIALLALVAFGRLAAEVVLEQELRAVDGAAAGIARLLRSPASDRVFVAVTLLGAPLTWAILSGALIIVLALRRKWTLVLGWAIAILGGGALDLALKLLFRRPRPTGAGEFIASRTWSFPSGHAMGSLVGYGMLAYLLIVHLRSGAARVAVATTALLLVVAIGISRIYLGVHYFTDVVAGYVAGALWLSTCITAMEMLRRRSRPRPPDR